MERSDATGALEPAGIAAAVMPQAGVFRVVSAGAVFQEECPDPPSPPPLMPPPSLPPTPLLPPLPPLPLLPLGEVEGEAESLRDALEDECDTWLCDWWWVLVLIACVLILLCMLCLWCYYAACCKCRWVTKEERQNHITLKVAGQAALATVRLRKEDGRTMPSDSALNASFHLPEDDFSLSDEEDAVVIRAEALRKSMTWAKYGDERRTPEEVEEDEAAEARFRPQLSLVKEVSSCRERESSHLAFDEDWNEIGGAGAGKGEDNEDGLDDRNGGSVGVSRPSASGAAGRASVAGRESAAGRGSVGGRASAGDRASAGGRSSANGGQEEIWDVNVEIEGEGGEGSEGIGDGSQGCAAVQRVSAHGVSEWPDGWTADARLEAGTWLRQNEASLRPELIPDSPAPQSDALLASIALPADEEAPSISRSPGSFAAIARLVMGDEDVAPWHRHNPAMEGAPKLQAFLLRMKRSTASIVLRRSTASDSRASQSARASARLSSTA